MYRVLGSAAAAADVLVNNNIKSMRKWWAVYTCGGDRWTCAQSSLNWESNARRRRARLERASERARETLRMRAGTTNTRAHTRTSHGAPYSCTHARKGSHAHDGVNQSAAATQTTKTIVFF